MPYCSDITERGSAIASRTCRAGGIAPLREDGDAGWEESARFRPASEPQGVLTVRVGASFGSPGSPASTAAPGSPPRGGGCWEGDRRWGNARHAAIGTGSGNGNWWWCRNATALRPVRRMMFAPVLRGRWCEQGGCCEAASVVGSGTDPGGQPPGSVVVKRALLRCASLPSNCRHAPTRVVPHQRRARSS